MIETFRSEATKPEKQPQVSVKNPTPEEEWDLLERFDPGRWDLNELENERDEEDRKKFLIEAGSKSLLLQLIGYEFVTVVVNNGKEKIQGDTTAAYRQAREIMQSEVDRLNEKLHYEIITEDTKMVKWAHSTGNEIFGWHKIEEPTDTSKMWYFVTKIEPSRVESNY